MAASQPLSFAAQLQRLRRAARLTQRALGKRAGLSESYLGQLERGVHTPVRATAELLAQALRLGAADRALLLGTLPARRLDAPPGQPEAPLLPLVGRVAEMARLDRFLAGEGPPLLAVTSEPGMGKSRLLREVLAHAASQGVTSLWGGCHRRSGQEPYEPLLGALLGYLRRASPERQRLDLRGSNWLVRLAPELAAAAVVPVPLWILPAEHERHQMFAAVRQFLANVAGTGRVLLMLDDLQWAGMVALDLLGALIRPAPAPGLRVLVALRDTDVRPDDPLAVLLAELEREGQADRMPLGALTAGESAALLEQLLPPGAPAAQAAAPPDAAVRQRILERADGVPLYLVSCVSGWRASGEEFATPGSVVVDALGVPLTLAQSIRLRVLALPGVARQVLEAAAVVGRVAPHALLAYMLEPSGVTVEALEEGLGTASAAGLLVEDGPTAHAFAHDLIREALIVELGATRRRALHGRLARALEDAHAGKLDAVSGQIALHYGQSNEPGKAIPYLERAGDHARSLYANAEAEGHYRDLIARLGTRGHLATRARAREKLGAVLSSVARFDDARQMLERAVAAYRAGGDQEGVLSASARLAQVDGASGAARAGIARLQQVLREQDHPRPSAGLAALHATLANLHYMCDQYNEQSQAAERAAEVARAIADGRVLAAAERERGIALLNLGRVAEAQAVLEQTVALADAVSDLWTLCYTLRGLSVVYVARGELEQGYRAARRAMEYAQLTGAPLVTALMAQRISTVAYFMGQWEETRAEGERAVAYLEEIGPSLARLYPLLTLGRLALSQGQMDVAEAQLGEAIALAERSGNLYGLRSAHGALAERDLLSGDPAAARARLAPLLDRPGHQEGDVIALLILLAWACAELGEEERAGAFLAESEARAAPEQMRATLVDTLRVQALLALRQQRWQTAQDALAESLALARNIAYPYAEAKALYTFGLLHQQRGEPEQARPRLEAALAILNRLGERLYAAYAERALATLDQAST